MTVAISTVISAFNSLTLSPALAALLLKGHDEPKDWLTRAMDGVFGGFFKRFNKVSIAVRKRTARAWKVRWNSWACS